MKAQGKVFRYKDNVDTDVIIPARYLNTSVPSELAKHCMEDIDKDFVNNVQAGDIIVADKNYVVVGAPILSGGVVATITMQTAVEGHSVELGVFAALVMVVQGFVGYPVCSLCLKSEAKRVRSLVESGQELKGVTAKIVTDAAPKKRLIPYIPDKYNGPNIMMAKVAFFAFLATITANAINGWIASTF